MWKSSAVVHVKAIINHSSVAMCRLEVVEILLIRFLFCSTAISQMCRHVTWHVCCTMSVCSRTNYTHTALKSPAGSCHACAKPPAVQNSRLGARERMKITLALFFANAANLIVCNDVSLYRTRREEDHNGRDGESSENDVGSGIDEFSDEAFPSVSPLIPLRFSFLTTDSGAEGGLRYSESSIPALELAIEHINANSSILPDFDLTFNLKRLQVKYRIIAKLLRTKHSYLRIA